MIKDIKNNSIAGTSNLYVPASVKVIEVTAHRVICQSGEMSTSALQTDDQTFNF